MRLNAPQVMLIGLHETKDIWGRVMKVMLSAFAVAIMVAASAAFILNTEFQETADERFIGAGAVLRPNEAGSNLVGPNWTGLNTPAQKH